MTKQRMSRTKAEILKELKDSGAQIYTDGHGQRLVYVTCHNCGGSGDYPSSMIPAGRCRFYCWLNRSPETFGKLPVKLDSYVRSQQAADRAEHKRKIREAEARGTKEKRLADPDERILTLAQAFGLTDLSEADQAHIHGQTDRNYQTALSLICQWLNGRELSANQWELAAKLPVWEAERKQRVQEQEEKRAASQWIGDPGERLELEVTVVHDRELESSWAGRWNQSATRTTLVKMEDTEGNALTWFSSSWPQGLQKGARARIRGTVTKQTTYEGQRQTQLKRVKVLEMLEQAPTD
jgi:hypothetical protein